jgi:NDP-sugar pyrophosphorylase family protein
VKALLVAAGRGTRLGALTAERPKPMIPIGGIPMIERIMSGIAEQTSIREFVLVTGYLASVIESYFGDGSRWGWKVEYVHQAEQLGLGHAVNLASDKLRDGAFLFTYGDIMLDPANYGAFEQTYSKVRQDGVDCAALLGLNWVDDPYRGAAVSVDDENWVVNIEEKPPKGTSKTNWNNAGLFIFEPLVFDYTERLTPSARGEFELPDAIAAMMRDGLRIKGIPLTGSWRDVGTPEDYEAINKEFEEARQ